MTESDWKDDSEWRNKFPTIKQRNIVRELFLRLIANMTRGQVFDLIEGIGGHNPPDVKQPLPKIKQKDYLKLKEELKKKKRSWKWKEDLK